MKFFLFTSAVFLMCTGLLKSQAEYKLSFAGGYLFTQEENASSGYWKNGYSLMAGICLPTDNEFEQSFIFAYSNFNSSKSNFPTERIEVGSITNIRIENTNNIALSYMAGYFFNSTSIKPFIQAGIGASYSFGGDIIRTIDYSTNRNYPSYTNEVQKGSRDYFFQLEGYAGVEAKLSSTVSIYIKGGIKQLFSNSTSSISICPLTLASKIAI